MFFYDLSSWVLCSGLIIMLVGMSLVGLKVARHYLLPRLQVTSRDSEFAGTMVQGVLVFYGLSTALIAVSVFETSSEVSRIVSVEATALAALYRDVDGYPEASRSHLHGLLREYTRYVIHEAWPEQTKGLVPRGGVNRMDRFQQILTSFEPATEGQKIVHAETLRAYNHMMEARRARLDAVDTELPSVMWWVLIVGAIISMSSTYFFHVEDIRLHSIMVALLATFIALVLFMIVALEQPFRGDLGITPHSYELIYEQLMKPAAVTDRRTTAPD